MSHHLSFMYSSPGQSGVDIRSSQSHPTSWMLKIVAPESPASRIDWRSRVMPLFVTLAPCQCHQALAPRICGGLSNSVSSLSAGEGSPDAVATAVSAAAAVIMTLNIVYLLTVEILHHARPFGNPHGIGVVSAPAEDVAEASATSR